MLAARNKDLYLGIWLERRGQEISMVGFKPAVKPGIVPAKCRAQCALGGPGKGVPFPERKRTEHDSGWPNDRGEDLDDHGDGSDPFDAGNLVYNNDPKTIIVMRH